MVEVRILSVSEIIVNPSVLDGDNVTVYVLLWSNVVITESLLSGPLGENTGLLLPSLGQPRSLALPLLHLLAWISPGAHLGPSFLRNVHIDLGLCNDHFDRLLVPKRVHVNEWV